MNCALKTELKKMGASACAASEPILSNPFLVHEACPGATGESVADWVAKVDAWDSGWNIEDAAFTAKNLTNFNYVGPGSVAEAAGSGESPNS